MKLDRYPFPRKHHVGTIRGVAPPRANTSCTLHYIGHSYLQFPPHQPPPFPLSSSSFSSSVQPKPLEPLATFIENPGIFFQIFQYFFFSRTLYRIIRRTNALPCLLSPTVLCYVSCISFSVDLLNSHTKAVVVTEFQHKMQLINNCLKCITMTCTVLPVSVRDRHL